MPVVFNKQHLIVRNISKVFSKTKILGVYWNQKGKHFFKTTSDCVLIKYKKDKFGDNYQGKLFHSK